MTPQEFIAKWQRANLSERSACQQHFLDLCDLLGQAKPAAADPDGAWYTFERGVHKTSGERGWADVWMRGRFGWEYKRKRKNLKDAYDQLLLYREDLENPPLLVVCDLDRFEIHTNFTGTPKHVHAFDLAGLAEPENLDKLRKLFTDPESLRPGLTTEGVTSQAAERFGQLADGMRVRGVEATAAAHFLMKLIFCMFGEDIELLPEKVFGRVLEGSKQNPEQLSGRLKALFEAMCEGGYFGAVEILHFDGGLFADADVVRLRPAEIEELIRLNDYDWASVEPSIFGTLFERTLDPAKRSQIGAHYTSRADILTLLEPVVMTPLRREWQEVRATCDGHWEKAGAGNLTRKTRDRHVKQMERRLLNFVERLAHVRILDPACGSGNFLYVAINLLMDLEKEVIAYGATRGVSMLPHVRPTQLHGIEISEYAQQLAQVVIWIGYLQWMHHNGFRTPTDPVLEPIETIHLKDAILDLTDPENPKEPEWPEADFIVGNPPFLGGGKIRSELGDSYTDKLFHLYGERLPNFSDLCCYWFEKSREMIRERRVKRAGLLATQGIRGGANREVLKRIKNTGNIFWSHSDREWILDGAMVHVSMVGFDDCTEQSYILDDTPVSTINPDLTATADVTTAMRLAPNADTCFMGPSPKAPFDIHDAVAQEMLHAPVNPAGCPNSDVIRPVNSAVDLVQRSRDKWTIDFAMMEELQAASYQLPFEFVKDNVLPVRQNRRDDYRGKWWQYARPRVEMRAALAGKQRFVSTPGVSKHRIFVWRDSFIVCNQGTLVFARDEDLTLGVLHCRVHELWARSMGTQLRERESGFRYTPTTCFETFPFPEPTDAQKTAISAAAKELDGLRNNWLNPAEWTREEVLEFPGSVDGPWARYIDPATVKPGVCPDFPSSENGTDPLPRGGIGTVRYPRTVPRDADCAKKLKKRTLTNLYNERPTWLDLAHKKLDKAVFAAYGWDPGMSNEELLEKLLALNLERATEES